MTAVLGANSWGKTGVQLVRVSHDAADGGYTVHDLTVSTELHGDTEDVYVEGDNGKVLSTDAQKNTVIAFAKEWPADSLETLAARLAHHFVNSQEPVERAKVEIIRDSWRRVPLNGKVALDAFEAGAGPQQVVTASVSTRTATLGGGLHGLKLLKARGSEFIGFPRDAYTTGTDVADRVLVTDLAAEWTYDTATVDPAIDYTGLHETVHATLAATFAQVHSRSIQYSMLAMATAVFDASPNIATLTLTLPNIHHTPADLSPFGLTNEDEILIPAQRTHSLIQATFGRE